jgi:hypothetical protein
MDASWWLVESMVEVPLKYVVIAKNAKEDLKEEVKVEVFL